MKKVKLVPPDVNQCQAEKREATFMSLGGDCMKLTRCKNKPVVIATEITPASDGQVGSMSLCKECVTAMMNQCGVGFATLRSI